MNKIDLALIVNLSADECADIANGKQRFVMIGNGYAQHIRRYLKENKRVRVYFCCSKKGELWRISDANCYYIRPKYKSLDKRPSLQDFRSSTKYYDRLNGNIIGYADVNAMVSISYEPQIEEYLSSNDGVSFNIITANHLMNYCRNKIKYGDGFALYFRIGDSKGYLYDNPLTPTCFVKLGGAKAFASIPDNLEYSEMRKEADRFEEKYRLKKAPSRYTYVEAYDPDSITKQVREI